MKFASVRIITDDLDAMVDFYETVTGLRAQRPAPLFAELVSAGATLAIGDVQTMSAFGVGAASTGTNRSVIIESQVDDVDADYARLQELPTEWVQRPTTMPWGNRSALLRDPDGNLVNLYAPVTDEARARFADR